ncbi:MAG: TatD family hydrolase [Gammaproteobacteria bacterium]
MGGRREGASCERFELIDTHCHVDLLPSEMRGSAYWRTVYEAGVTRLVIPGLQVEQWSAITRLNTSPVTFYCAAGLHPWRIKSDSCSSVAVQTIITSLRRALKSDLIVAVGECGLDGCIAVPLAEQVPVFEAQVQLAIECERALMVHARGAHQALMGVLKRYAPPKGGVIHAFSGSYEMAKAYWDRGFYLGVGGTITYPRANKTRRALAKMPLTALLLETDSPDMPLCGYQGQPNGPLRLPEVAAALAALQGLTVDRVAEITTANAMRCFEW